MVSKRIKFLFLLSIPLFVAHGIEEYMTGFYNFDPILFSHLKTHSKELYIVSQIGLVVFALFTYYFLLDKKIGLVISLLWGLLLILELEHFYRALSLHMYTSGFITGLLLVILGIFYWKELITTFRKKKRPYARN